MKRYAIVRVDDKCPINTEENFYCFEYLQKDNCKKCKEIVGDTKEQLVLKIAQVLIRRKLKAYKNILGGVPDEKFAKDIYSQCLNASREIIEFLGVE